MTKMVRFVASLILASSVYGAPVRLRCEYLDNPLGIDIAAPHLSWQDDSEERNWSQSAYQILVANSAQELRLGRANVWDSGRQTSAESVGIVYGGPALQSATRYYWTVRVWDASGRMSLPAGDAWWETGLLAKTDWIAKWISRNDPEEEADRAGIRWIWAPGQDAFAVPPATIVVFRAEVTLADRPRDVALYLRSIAGFKAKVNGHDAGAKDGQFQEFDREDVTEFMVTGNNSIEVSVKTDNSRVRAAALAGLVKIVRSDGSIERTPTDGHWQTEAGAAVVIANLGVSNDRRFGPDPGPLPGPAALFRREFTVSRPVATARLYVTALGSYRAFINGNRAGNDVLTPEYTDYRKRVTYQTYDVTTFLTRGANVIAAMLGDGWFASGSTWTGTRFSFLPPPTRLLAQLRIKYADGSGESIGTDESWKTSAAPVVHSEIYAGETYDARLEQPGWDRGRFDDARWANAVLGEPPPGVVSAEVTAPVRVVETVKAKAVTRAGDAFIFDMGQNMVGWVKLTATGPAGTKIRLRFGEILKPDGTIYTDNLRDANQTDAFYLRGSGSGQAIEETFEPYFTFHGFRYVEVTGYPVSSKTGMPPLESIAGQVASSMHTVTGKLATSSELVNHMWQVGIWGQRGNFLSIPTDCPQRDERLGWMGDAEVFWRTGSYNADIAAFGHKWMRDVVDGQSEEGAFGNTAPGMPNGSGSNLGAPGWGDAGVIVPWTAWQHFGDKGLVEDVWPAMETWLDFIQEANPDFLRRNKTGSNYADWLAPGSETPTDLVATAYWALIAQMMRDMAAAIGRPDDAKHYSDVCEKIRSAFQNEFVKADGQIGSGSQTSYVLALQMMLVPESLKPLAMNNLIKDIEAHDWHLTTGFLGTPHLLFVLSDNGRADVAYRLLLNETYPSWGYMLSKGATTWWERWDGDSGDPSMNSFNHYALGSVVAWVYRYVAGIDTAADAPGFRRIVIHPRMNERVTHASGEYDSVYGRIATEWTAPAGGPFTLKVRIPANTMADVYLPAFGEGKVTEDGKPVTSQREKNEYVIQIGSGSYAFEVR
jgi:alpha-L-rhamnosidase